MGPPDDAIILTHSPYPPRGDRIPLALKHDDREIIVHVAQKDVWVAAAQGVYSQGYPT